MAVDARTERAECVFVARCLADGTPWLALELRGAEPNLIARQMLRFAFRDVLRAAIVRTCREEAASSDEH